MRTLGAFGFLLALAAVCGAEDEALETPEAGKTSKSGYEDVPQFGGPGSVGDLLKEDDALTLPVLRFPWIDRSLEGYFDWKKRVNEEHGLAFGFDYTGVYLTANESPGRDESGGGIFRIFGSWTLMGRGTETTGTLVYKVEHRHAYTSVAPVGFGFEIGSLTLEEPPFGNQGWMLTNLYWNQRFLGGKANFVVGWLDVTDYLNIYGLISPWLHFFNFEFSTGTTIPVPNQGLGLAGAAMVAENIYVVAGVVDQNGDPTDPGQGFESFFDQHEFFTHIEIGWVSSFEERYLDNVHVLLWHADPRHNAGVPESWGVAFSAAKFVDGKWMPFLRGGYADGDAPLMQASVTAGVGRYFRESSDLMALGLGWAKPADGSLREQYVVEVFYRLQIAESVAITFDVQLLIDPALNPAEDVIVVVGVRGRLAF